MNRSLSLALLPSFILASTLFAAEPTITLDPGKPAGIVSPLLYGLMTEEINHCYDGGLYAELIQNRAFLDDPKAPAHWSAVAENGAAATIQLDDKNPVNSALPMSLRLEATVASGTARAGIANEGFWGIPVYPNTPYKASFHAKAAPGFAGKARVCIQSEDGKTVYAQGEVSGIGPEWKEYQVALKTGELAAPLKGRYVIAIDQPGTVWFSLVSLFPPTWKDRPNGLRKDLMQKLVEMKPRFLRFPGGNYLEGDTIQTRFEWKKTLGPIEGRPGHQGPWNYRSSDGMGLMEFLLWCEDMGAEPVLAVYGGYSLKGQWVKPGPELEPYVQEALEEIEYVTGPATSKWGAQRARDGHPKPFKLHYVEIGNEDFFDRSNSYDGRFTQFYEAIKTKFPRLECISTIGFGRYPSPEKARMHSRKPEVIDEHYYRSTDEFVAMAPDFYEKYDRKGPKIFVGEWAAHEDAKIRPWKKEALSQPVTPNMKTALGDAVWMTAMERNSDQVIMQCYAPLLVNANAGAWQWRPDLIGYDALRSYGSPSYYAIAMFSTNLGDQILKVSRAETPVQVSATRDSKTREIFLKLVNPTGTEQTVKIAGLVSAAPTATAITLAANPEETNSLEAPTKVIPKQSKVEGIKPGFSYKVPANGIVVLKLKAK